MVTDLKNSNQIVVKEGVMNRYLLLSVILVAFLISGPSYIFAAATGTCVYTHTITDNIETMKWVCTADGSGTFAAIAASTQTTRGWVFNVDTKAGGTAPTGGTGFTLIESRNGSDVMGANCTTVLGTGSNRCVPAKSGWVGGATLTPTFTGSYGANAVFTLEAAIWLQKQ
jgi:hypothetical protein